jgi:hypothetical protein
MPILNKSKTLTGTVPVCLVHALRATTKSTDGNRVREQLTKNW